MFKFVAKLVGGKLNVAALDHAALKGQSGGCQRKARETLMPG